MTSTMQARARSSQFAMRVLDVTAATLTVLGAVLLFSAGPDNAGEGRRWVDLSLAIAGGTMMLVAAAASVLRRNCDGDEYARRLGGQAAMIGFYAAMTGYVIWRPLAESWVAGPSADQMMGLLFASTGLGYVVARVRGTW